MENASKALIMAGGVLIALMVVAALMLMFNNLSEYQNYADKNVESAQIAEFNNQYVTYNRDNVRGSDLYSLINRAINYNERKTSTGTEGKEFQYEPITITFDFDGKVRELAMDNNLLIKNNEYTLSGTGSTFESVIQKINQLQNKYGSNEIVSLTTNMTKIFIEDTSTEDAKERAVIFYNNIAKTDISDWSSIAPGSQIRTDIYTYYEYVQFKRAYFDCTETKYSSQTGRVISMKFKFNGRLN